MGHKYKLVKPQRNKYLGSSKVKLILVSPTKDLELVIDIHKPPSLYFHHIYTFYYIYKK